MDFDSKLGKILSILIFWSTRLVIERTNYINSSIQLKEANHPLYFPASLIIFFYHIWKQKNWTFFLTVIQILTKNFISSKEQREGCNKVLNNKKVFNTMHFFNTMYFFKTTFFMIVFMYLPSSNFCLKYL